MARWIKHTGCLSCGSRDNLGVYDDGSTFCFGCHAWSKPSDADKLREFAAHRFVHAYEPVNSKGEVSVELPLDYTLDIPAGCHNWLTQYLSASEIKDAKIGYSPNYKRIIFPVYDRAMKLLLWTGRGGEGVTPKYLTMGLRNFALDVLSANQLSDRVVVVEDRVSALVVSRVCSSVALFGSQMPLEWATTLSKAFSGLVMWLDPDKHKEALQQAVRLSPYFQRGVKVIFSKDDPKCYNPVEVSRHIGPS